MYLYNRIERKINYYRKERYIMQKSAELLKHINQPATNNRIYFFCTPTHSNLGDQAQLLCWLRLFYHWYPSYEIICVPTAFRQFKTIRTIRENLKEKDLIFIHSGYLIFDPHPELPFILDVVRAFYDRKIVILPQTVNLIDEWYRQIVMRTFNSHSNLTLICRDEVSFSFSKELFPKIKLALMPDVVTSLIGDSSFHDGETQRKGVLFCMRNDGEKLYNVDQIKELRSRFKGIRTDLYDTTVNLPMWKWENGREKYIHNVLKKFSSYQLIITDRYHGTIFSQIVDTPVIVISSTDHKLSSGVKWFPRELFGKMVFFANNLNDAYSIAMKLLSEKRLNDMNPSWFKDTYYSKPL